MSNSRCIEDPVWGSSPEQISSMSGLYVPSVAGRVGGLAVIKFRVETGSHMWEMLNWFACCISGLAPNFLQLDTSPNILEKYKQQTEPQPTHY